MGSGPGVARQREPETSEDPAGDLNPGIDATVLPFPPTVARTRRVAVLHELTTQYPAWMLLGLAASMLNMALANLGTPRWDLAWPTVFPLGLFCGFYALRARQAVGPGYRRSLLTGAVGAAFALIGAVCVFHPPTPLGRTDLLRVYELSNFIGFVPLVVFGWTHGHGTRWVFFGGALLYGMLLENGGIALGYFAELAYRLYIPGLVAPIATMLGWVMVMYMCTFLTWQARAAWPKLQSSPLASGALVAAAGLAFDLQVDPIATASGCWVWDSRLPPFFLGVPLINFVAWIAALWPFGTVLFAVQARHGLTDGGAWPARAVRDLVLAVPLALTAASLLFLGAMAVVEGGTDGPTFVILGEFLLKVEGLLLA